MTLTPTVTPLASQSSSATTTSSNAGSTVSAATLNSQSFLQLLAAQMENQNPLEPMKDADYFTQIAQIGQYQNSESMQRAMDVSQAQTLMGKTVTATAQDQFSSHSVTGTVQSMSYQNGEYYLGVQGADGSITSVKLSGVTGSQATDNSANYAYLVGQNATGLGSYTSNGSTQQVSATGKIVGITTINGQQFARIQTNSYGVVNVGVSNLTSVGN